MSFNPSVKTLQYNIIGASQITPSIIGYPKSNSCVLDLSSSGNLTRSTESERHTILRIIHLLTLTNITMNNSVTHFLTCLITLSVA